MPRPLNKDACNTCRRRKVKCGGQVPVCQQCSKAGRYCDRSAVSTHSHGTQVEHPDEELCNPRSVLAHQQEARLFNNYIAEISKWYDLSDPSRHFEYIVPRFSLDHPLLFCAIMALSAMHMGKTCSRGMYKLAETYHSRCLQLLIGLDDQDELVTNGVALAATCLLRSYEILDGKSYPFFAHRR
ncbi:hypothetical protein B0I35DRAFT_279822 [Stachybotrys elegans]|uniref:Zn(2)-C6 fungal-type domain-containing protein n=1 Tax=Stachybotrys elegans TaxID=80388 RepID=A0A8K0SSF5_9HYPO|nr:hypothetical protein B0I35DRAFT_279822 [Stachybotrys elegans]